MTTKTKLFFILFLSLPISLSAQTLKGKWTRTFLGTQFQPGDMAFSDTNHGFVEVGGGFIVYHSNNGFQRLDTLNLFDYFNGEVGLVGTGRFNAAFCIDSENYFIAPLLPGSGIASSVYSSSDGGFNWTSQIQEFFRNPKNHNTISACQYYNMLSLDTGVVLAIVPGAGKVDTPYNGYYVSFDGDSSYQELGNPIWHEPIGGYAANLQDLFALTDTLTASEGQYTWKQFLMHSTDSGKDWQTIFPVDTTKQFTSLTPMVKGYGTGHYFLTGGRVSDTAIGERKKIDDYLESTDDGATWVAHSNVSGGRVFQIANPAPNVLWASVGHVSYVTKYVYPNQGVGNIETSNGTRISTVDSMFVSLDNGKTWQKDGQTFAGDTIYHMVWLTATNGYAVTYRNDSAFLYHFTGSIVDSTPASVSADMNGMEFHNRPVKLTAFPDPTKDLVHVNLSYESSLSATHIFDVVDREMHPPTSFEGGELTIDASDLTVGSYFMNISGASGYTYIVRFSREP